MADQILVKEDLPNVLDGAPTVCRIWQDRAVDVGEDVDVGGAAGVVTWEDGGELGDAVILSRLKAAKEGLVDVRGIIGIAITTGYDAGVDASSIAVPKVNLGVHDGVTCGGVDDLEVDDKLDALLVLDQVTADVLPVDYHELVSSCLVTKELANYHSRGPR